MPSSNLTYPDLRHEMNSPQTYHPDAYLDRLRALLQQGTIAVGTFDAVNATWDEYAAVGDGVADDHAAITAALATGRPVFLPAGTYLVTEPLVLPAGATLYGAGMGKTTIILDDAIDGNVIEVTSVADVSVRDLTVDGNAAGQSTAGGGILASGSVDMRIERVHVTETFESGIRLNAASNRNVIAYCRFSNATGGGTHSDGVHGNSADDNIVLGCVFVTAKQSAVQIAAGDHWLIESNLVLASTASAIIVGGASMGTVVRGNQIQGSAVDGVIVTDTAVDTVVSGNVIRAPGDDGISLTGTADQTTVVGNSIFDAAGTGIEIAAGVTNTQAVDNYLHGCATAFTDAGTSSIIRRNHGQGFAPAIASAATIAAKSGFATVTGTTDITTITATFAGDVITLQFTDALPPDLKHGTGNLVLTGAADFSPAQNDACRLVCDGTNWIGPF